ncbi:hypothetical protein K8I61_14285 [bacterium]|nr:hypothetical protein [bacterium]
MRVLFAAMLIALFAASLGAAGCGGGESGASTPSARGDDDDGTGAPDPDDDDAAGDDDFDDDASDDDDAGDDDADDDDASDDDATDDDTDDDDSDDDDDDDSDDDSDDDTGDDDSDPPVVTIAKPESGKTYNTHEITVEARAENADFGSVRAYYDSVDVTSLLSIVQDQGGATADGYDFDITGKIDGVTAGPHQFRVAATNADGTTVKTSNFDVFIDDPYLELAVSDNLVQPDESVTASVTIYDENGAPVNLTYTYGVSPNSGFSRNGDVFTFTQTGSYTITASATYKGDVLSDSETVEVKDLIPASVDMVLSTTETVAGVPVIANATVKNAGGEALDGFLVVYTVFPSAGVTVNGNIVTMTKARSHKITGTVQGTSIKDNEDCNVIPGQPAKVVLTISKATINAGQSITWSAKVTDLFDNEIDGAITLTVTPTTGVVVNGNTITFNKAKTTPFKVKAQYTFLFDTKDVQVNDNREPSIAWTSPERGSVTGSSGVTVQGVVTENESALKSFKINDQNVVVGPTGQFTHVVGSLEWGVNIIEAIAIDDFDNTSKANISVMRGQLLPDDEMIEGVIGVRINDSGLTEIEEFVAEAIGELDITELLDPYLPFVMGNPGDALYVVGDFTTFNFGSPTIDLQPQVGGLGFDAAISGIDMDGYIDISYSGGAPARFTMEISGTITAGADIGIDIVSDTLEVSLDNFTVSLAQLTVVLNGIDSAPIIALLQSLMQQLVSDLLEGEVADLLDDLFADLDLSFATDIEGVNYNFEFDFNDVDFYVDGGTIWIDGRVTADTVDPDTRDIGGSLFTAGALPTLDMRTPVGNQLYGFGVALGDDFINQMLYRFFRAGLITIHINEEFADEQGFQWDLTTTDLAFFLPGLADLYPDAPIEFWLDPQLPPVVIFSDDGGLGLELQIGDLLMDLKVIPDGESPVNALGVAAGITVPLSIDIDTDTQALSLIFGQPTVAVDVYDSQFIYFPYGLIEQLIPFVVELALPLISNMLQDIPLPVFEGFAFPIVETSAFGLYDDYLGIFGDLELITTP